MSKHLSRKERWTRQDAKKYTSDLGNVVYRQDAWFARLIFELRLEAHDISATPSWVVHEKWIGPCKRPRNAMIELEREIAVLRNRHGENIRIGKEIRPR